MIKKNHAEDHSDESFRRVRRMPEEPWPPVAKERPDQEVQEPQEVVTEEGVSSMARSDISVVSEGQVAPSERESEFTGEGSLAQIEPEEESAGGLGGLKPSLFEEDSQEALQEFLKQTRKSKRSRQILPEMIRNLDQKVFHWKRDWKLLLGAFLIPVLILGLVYALQGFYPFGDRTPLTVDLYHQYAPFLNALRDKLRGGESFWYSWNGSLGMNFLAVFAYYLASPLNLLYALFPATSVTDWVTVVELIKFGLCGLTFALFLRTSYAKTQAEKAREALIEQDSEELADLLPEGGFDFAGWEGESDSWNLAGYASRKQRMRQKRTARSREVEAQNRGFDPQNFGILMASIFYALSGFLVSYSWNIMWLDGLILFPLLMWGVHSLVSKGRFALYSVVLALAILTNYYIALFLCIFTFFYFFFVLFASPRGMDGWGRRTPKLGFVRLLQMGFATVVGVGLSAVLALPVYESLKLTSASSDAFPQALQFDFSVFAFLSRFLIGAQPVIRSGLPNLYCGLLLLVLLPLYLSCRKVHLGEKIGGVLLLGFLFLSLNANVLNFLWHGTHYPNQLPHRFAFVLILLILALGYRVLQNLKDLDPSRIAVSAGLVALYILIAEVLLPDLVSHERVYLNLIWLGLYAAVLLVGAHRSAPLRLTASLMVLLVIGEAILSTFLQVDSIAQTEYYGTRSHYVEKIEPVQRLLAEVRQDDPEFYRVELPNKISSDDPALFGYPGLSGFSSTASVRATKFMDGFGYASNGINSYHEGRATEFMDLLFGVKYRLQSSTEGDRQLERMSLIADTEMNADLHVYRRPQTLPVGYWVPQTLQAHKLIAGSALENQNEWARALGVQGKPIYAYEPLQLDSMNTVEADLPDQANEPVTLKFSDRGESQAAHLKLTPSVSGNLVLEIRSSDRVDVTARFPNGRGETETREPNQEKTTTVQNPSIPLSPSGTDSTVAEPTDNRATVPSETQMRQAAAPNDSHSVLAVNANGSQVLDLGTVQAGQQVTLQIQADHAKDSVKVLAAMAQPEAIQNAYRSLQPGALQVEAYNSNTLQGQVQVKEPGLLFFTIPYDPNWKAWVDGQEVPVQEAAEAWLSVPVSAGNHSVQIQYVPQSFRKGLAISCGALLLLLGGMLVSSFARKRREEENT